LKIPQNLLDHIQGEAEKVDYGEIIIKLNGTSNKIDVITQSRRRFDKAEENEKQEG
jgi:hypothetical protein